MTVDPVAFKDRGIVRFATPYTEIETQPTSSLERMIVRELAQARLAAKRTGRKARRRSSLADSSQAGRRERSSPS